MKNGDVLRASLDMGTTKVSAMIGEIRDDIVRVIGVGTTTSEGFKQGVVVDIEQATESVEKSILEAEQMAGISMRRFNVGIAGEHIRSMNSRGVVAVPRLDHEISREDVDRAMKAAKNFTIPYDREIIHALPQEFIVDGQKGMRQPIGMFGSRLEARVHVVTASRPALDNVIKVIALANVEVGQLVLEPLASSCAVLTEDERELGSMLIDIGGGTTDVLVFSERGVMASGVIGLGGNNITSDVAYGLRTAAKFAEELKIDHGCALSSMVPVEDTIDVPGIGFRDKRQIGRQILSAIIEPRVTEIFTIINNQITKNDLKRMLGAGVVLTGGASMLEGTRELAEQVFEMPVRLGIPVGVEGLAEVVNHPMFATGVGLMFYKDESESKGGERGIIGKGLRKSFDQLRRAIASHI